MQEPSAEKDKEHCDRVNELINNPNAGDETEAVQGGSGSSTGSDPLRSILDNVTRRIAPQGTSTSTAPRSTQTSSTAPRSTQTSSTAPRSTQTSTRPAGNQRGSVPDSQLQNILSSLQHQQRPSGPSLNDILSADAMVELGVFSDQEIINETAEFLPEQGATTTSTFETNVRSPQFQQAVQMFTYALRSGDLAGELLSMGIDPGVIGPNSTLEEFIVALQNATQQHDSMDTDQ